MLSTSTVIQESFVKRLISRGYYAPDLICFYFKKKRKVFNWCKTTYCRPNLRERPEPAVNVACYNSSGRWFQGQSRCRLRVLRNTKAHRRFILQSHVSSRPRNLRNHHG